LVAERLAPLVFRARAHFVRADAVRIEASLRSASLSRSTARADDGT